jgi:hypothetical protein
MALIKISRRFKMGKKNNIDLQNTTQEIKKNEHNEPHKKTGRTLLS